MPSTSRAAAAVLLTALLGLCALPAAAQPKGTRATDQVETKTLEAVWQWLTSLWAPAGPLEQGHKALTQDSIQSLSPNAGLNRGGVYDPNGNP